MKINIEGYNKISYVYHIADIHIRDEIERKNEYIEVFNNFVENIKKESDEKNNESIIIIVGDILNTRESSDIKTEIFRYMIKKFIEVMPVIFVAGNHDYKKDNDKNANILEKMIEDTIYNNKKVFYLMKSGEYMICNIIIGLSDIREQENGINIYEASKIKCNNNEKKIGIYHGLVNDNNVSLFNGYDIVMLGDIHKHKYINNERTIGYSGSLIQQNFGESLIDHGYIKWDIKNKKGEFHKVKNNYGYINVDIKNDNIIINELPNNIRIKYIYENKEEYEIYKNKFERKIIEKNKKIILIKERYNKNKYNIENIENINGEEEQKIIYKIMEEIMIKLNISEKDQKIIIEKYKDKYLKYKMINEETDIQRINGKWKILKLEYENMLSYGSGNFNNIFGEDKCKIIGITGRNGTGKTSIINILLYALYGDISRYGRKKNIEENLINNKGDKKEMKTLIEIKINDTKITIIRKYNLEKKIKNEVEININNNMTNKIKKYNGLNVCNKIINNMIGDIDEFKRTTLIYQSQYSGKDEFIALSNSERFELLKKILNIEYLNKIREDEKMNELENEINKLTEEINEDENKINIQLKDELIIEKINNEINNIEKKIEINNKKLNDMIKKKIEEIEYINKKKQKILYEIEKIKNINENIIIENMFEKNEIKTDKKIEEMIKYYENEIMMNIGYINDEKYNGMKICKYENKMYIDMIEKVKKRNMSIYSILLDEKNKIKSIEEYNKKREYEIIKKEEEINRIIEKNDIMNEINKINEENKKLNDEKIDKIIIKKNKNENKIDYKKIIINKSILDKKINEYKIIKVYNECLSNNGIVKSLITMYKKSLIYYVNYFLDLFSDFNIDFNIDESIEIYYYKKKGKKMNIGGLSGYEMTVCNIAIRLAYKRINENNNMIIIDEGITNMDEYNKEKIEKIFNYIRTIIDKTIIISQDNKLKKEYDKYYEIKKDEEGYSKI